MKKDESIMNLSEILYGGPITWEKPDPDDSFRGILNGKRSHTVIYEDKRVFAFHPDVDSKNVNWEIHVVLIPKKVIPTLLDLGIADAQIWCALLNGVQMVARRLNLYKKGFVLKVNVLPPYQHTPRLHLHILSGKKKA